VDTMTPDQVVDAVIRAVWHAPCPPSGRP